MSPPNAIPIPEGSGLPWYQRLQTQFWLLFLVLMVVLGSLTYWLGLVLIRDTLSAESFRYETESARRVQTRLSALVSQAETLAAMIAELAAVAGDPANPTPAIPDMVNAADPEGLFTGIGIWPIPAQGQPRRSQLWLRSADGTLVARGDYNDPRAVPYTEAAWFTPTQFTQPHRCYWSPVRREPLIDRQLISCSMPLMRAERMMGVVTVAISVNTLESLFEEASQDTPGYSVLIDSDHRIIAASQRLMTALRDQPAANMAELGQRYPALSPLALQLFDRRQAQRSALTRSPAYDAGAITRLAAQTRDFSRSDAEQATAQIWSRLGAATQSSAEPVISHIQNDPLVGGHANAVVFELPQSGWTIIKVRAAQEGFSGAGYLFNQALVLTGGGVIIALLLISGALRALVINPLKRIAETLALQTDAESSLDIVLDESRRNEVGVIARLYNERTRHLRELMDGALSMKTKMSLESAQRRDLERALDRVRALHLTTLGALDDAWGLLDAEGRLVQVNPAMEARLDRRQTERVDRMADEVISLQGFDQPLSHWLRQALERGQAVELPEAGTWLSNSGDLPVTVHLHPVKPALQRRASHVVLVLRTLDRTADAQAQAQGDLSPVSGLPGRLSAERHVKRLLLEQAATSHAAALINLDRFEALNVLHGRTAGDELLHRVARHLEGAAGNFGAVYHLNGDEFLVVLEGFDANRAQVLISALCAQLAKAEFRWSSKNLSLTASAGVADLQPDAERPFNLLLTQVDAACQAAKQRGRNTTVTFTPELSRSQSLIDNTLWTRRITAGLQENRFHLTTQLIASSKVLQSEGEVFDMQVALEDEEGFWAEPSVFMPVAERLQLSPQIDRWIVSQSLVRLGQDPSRLAAIGRVRLRLSPSTVIDPDWLTFLIDAFETHGVPARHICFELPELDMRLSQSAVLPFCDAMRAIGCHLAGPHPLSLAAADRSGWRHLRLDEVVLDASSLAGLQTDAAERLMAEQALQLARVRKQRLLVRNLHDPEMLKAWQLLGADYLEGMAVARSTPILFNTAR